MKIDFEEFENSIINFTKENYKNYLRNGLAEPSRYINDFLDFDIYKDANEIFFDFENYNFNSLSNESEEQKINLKIYIVCRNDKSSELKKKILQYATDFYKFFEGSNNNFNGLIDYGKIDTVSFFDAVEGDTGLKLAQLSISMNAEI